MRTCETCSKNCCRGCRDVCQDPDCQVRCRCAATVFDRRGSEAPGVRVGLGGWHCYSDGVLSVVRWGVFHTVDVTRLCLLLRHSSGGPGLKSWQRGGGSDGVLSVWGGVFHAVGALLPPLAPLAFLPRALLLWRFSLARAFVMMLRPPI